MNVNAYLLLQCLFNAYVSGQVGPGYPNGLVRWTGYRFLVWQLLCCVFEPRLVPLSRALYHTCFIYGQRCKCWSRRPKLISSVISDVKLVIYINILDVDYLVSSLMVCVLEVQLMPNMLILSS